MLEIYIWIAIALVITLRSLAVYSHHFIQENQTGLRHQILGWFRFYKRGFSLTLGMVAFFLAAVAFLDGSLPWTLGNLVFGCAAFINFQKHRDFILFQILKSLFQSRLGSWVLYGFMPLVLFVILLSKDLITGTLSGSAFSYTGAYLLAVIFLSMKLRGMGTSKP